MTSANDRDSAGSKPTRPPADVPASAAPKEATGAGHAVSPPPKIASAAEPSPTTPPRRPEANRRSHRWRKLLLAVGVLAGLSFAGYKLAPEARLLLATVSTDDAYVNGHFTFVAPRVFGQVVEVLVDDNNRVRKGDLLVQLDKQPYQIQVRQKQATVALAKADLVAAQDDARALVAQARSNRFKLENTIEQVNNQIASLRANVAALETNHARLARAKADFARAKELQKTPGAISQQDVDLREEAFRVAHAEVTQALEQVYQVRASLGLPAKVPEGDSLAEVPANLDQNYSAVRQALADLLKAPLRWEFHHPPTMRRPRR